MIPLQHWVSVADCHTSAGRLQGSSNLGRENFAGERSRSSLIEELNEFAPCLIRTPLPGCAWTTVDLANHLYGDDGLLSRGIGNICSRSVESIVHDHDLDGDKLLQPERTLPQAGRGRVGRREIIVLTRPLTSLRKRRHTI